MEISREFTGCVTWVFDGDTIQVQSEGLKYMIRLWGIDAPEKDQAGGKTATKYLLAMLKSRTVKVKKINQDRYGRLVAKIYKGKTFVNFEMVQSGNAWWYQKYAPDADDLKAAESEARHDRRGLWSADAPLNPADFRRVINNDFIGIGL